MRHIARQLVRVGTKTLCGMPLTELPVSDYEAIAPELVLDPIAYAQAFCPECLSLHWMPLPEEPEEEKEGTTT